METVTHELPPLGLGFTDVVAIRVSSMSSEIKMQKPFTLKVNINRGLIKFPLRENTTQVCKLIPTSYDNINGGRCAATATTTEPVTRVIGIILVVCGVVVVAKIPTAVLEGVRLDVFSVQSVIKVRVTGHKILERKMIYMYNISSYMEFPLIKSPSSCRLLERYVSQFLSTLNLNERSRPWTIEWSESGIPYRHDAISFSLHFLYFSTRPCYT